MSSLPIFPGSSYSEVRPCSSVSEPRLILSATELALFSHYLAHTCRTIPFDTDELYVLQVGVPNLAFQSKPLMASLLALAAASKAFDLVRDSTTALQHMDEIHPLLIFADQHYQTSLREVQGAISCHNHFDHILANSAVMVLYGLASHCVRIRLAHMAILRNEQLPIDAIPHGTQWIFLIRAAHSAYVGLRRVSSHAQGEVTVDSTEKATGQSSMNRLDIPSLYGDRVISPEDGPSEMTRRVFFPILAATQASAFKRLRARFQTVALGEGSHVSSDPLLRTCFLALEILSNIVATVFIDDRLKTKYSEATNSDVNLSLNGPLSKVSSWLRTYIARVTSVEPSKPLRRTIMAFLNLVPMDYLSVVQLMLEQSTGDRSQQSSDNRGENCLLLDPKNQLALEIFAHWLVLVMLLDGVWWIGDLGDWEMRRILLFLDYDTWVSGAKESWWPKTMFNIRQELFCSPKVR